MGKSDNFFLLIGAKGTKNLREKRITKKRKGGPQGNSREGRLTGDRSRKRTNEKPQRAFSSYLSIGVFMRTGLRGKEERGLGGAAHRLDSKGENRNFVAVNKRITFLVL